MANDKTEGRMCVECFATLKSYQVLDETGRCETCVDDAAFDYPDAITREMGRRIRFENRDGDQEARALLIWRRGVAEPSTVEFESFYSGVITCRGFNAGAAEIELRLDDLAAVSWMRDRNHKELFVLRHEDDGAPSLANQEQVNAYWESLEKAKGGDHGK